MGSKMLYPDPFKQPFFCRKRRENKIDLLFLPVDTIRLSLSQSMVAGGEALTTHLKSIRITSKKLAHFINVK